MSPLFNENDRNSSKSPLKIIEHAPAAPIRYTTSFLRLMRCLKAISDNTAVRRGTQVYKDPVFNAVVVFNDSKKQIKNSEKNRLIIRARGSVASRACLCILLITTNGSRITAENKKRMRVNENGFNRCDNAADDMNEPAIRAVAKRIRRWDFNFDEFIIVLPKVA